LRIAATEDVVASTYKPCCECVTRFLTNLLYTGAFAHPAFLTESDFAKITSAYHISFVEAGR
jgi:hypothetical protein